VGLPSAGGKTSLLMRLRHVSLIALAAALLVGAATPLLSNTPLLCSLGDDDRGEFYGQMTTVSVTLMGFLITAVAILVSLDRGREIVKELRRGESFALLVLNLLAAVLLLFLLTALSLLGSVRPDGLGDAAAFAVIYEWLAIFALGEIALGGFYFCVVTYQVSSHE
jgi:hypothetical protein